MNDQARVALVTGSTRGLGRGIAERLATDGFAVAVNGSDAKRAADVVAAIRAQDGTAEAFVADVTDPAQVDRLVADVGDRLGPIQVLVLNATGSQPEAPITEVSWDDHLDQLRFFVLSPILLGQAVIPGMRTAGSGRIVHIDSEVVDLPRPGRSAYVTAKAAQIGLMRAWARELAPDGITVNSVSPGFIPVERHADVTESAIAAYRSSVPAGRLGTLEDVAAAVSYFVSEGAGFVTGQRLIVDGGRALGWEP